MNILVITTKNAVYATYSQTICFRQEFTNADTFEIALTNAKASAFGYACTGVKVNCNTVVLDTVATDAIIFDYLDKHARY